MSTKILTVDDEPDVMYTVKYGLEGLDSNFEVTMANTGEKCFEFLNKQRPDLILLDIMMPDMSGWEILKKIKEHPTWKSIPVIFLTARTDRVAKNAGDFLADDYIEKPFKIPELKQRIDKILGNIYSI